MLKNNHLAIIKVNVDVAHSKALGNKNIRSFYY